MGISIHYRGRLDDLSRLPEMMDELIDIAETMGWEWDRLDDDWETPANAELQHGDGGTQIKGNLGLKGVSLSPGGGCESLSFYFDHDGCVRSVMGMLLVLDGAMTAENVPVSAKTQFASPDVHAWIIGLLKYLQKRYMSNLTVADEGKYWETGNLETLIERRRLIERKLDEITGAVLSGQLGDVRKMTPEQIAARIAKFVSDRQED